MNLETRKNRTLTIIRVLFVIWVLVVSILVNIAVSLLIFNYKMSQQVPETLVSRSNHTLENILNKEMNVYIINGTCKDYATYYNKTLSEKYPELDIRFPRYVDICNNLTLCDNYHTFLVIGGWGSECLVDQHQLSCINII